MKTLITTCCLTILLLWVSVFAADADSYSYIAGATFDHVIDMAVAGDRVVVLSPGTLAILDASTPGPALARISSVSVDREFSEIAATRDLIAIASRGGTVELYSLGEASLLLSKRFVVTDSIIAMTLVADRLCLAQGFAGVRVFDLSDHVNPRVVQTLRDADYSAKVDFAGDLLFVLDALNGVVFYDMSGETYHRIAEIPADTPPSDISATDTGVAICFGTRRVESWHCSVLAGAVPDYAVELDFRASRIAGIRFGTRRFYASSESGDLASLNAQSGIVTDQVNLPYPVNDIEVFDPTNTYSLVALDRAGSLTAFTNELQNESSASYSGATAPTAICAGQKGLWVSTSNGLQTLDVDGTDLVVHNQIPGATVSTILTESGSHLFAGLSPAGKIWSFADNRGRWEPTGEIVTGLTLRKIFVKRGEGDEFVVVVVGAEGIKCYQSQLGVNFEPVCSLLVTPPISAADLAGDFLATTSENGDLALYTFADGRLSFSGLTGCARRPRDIVVTREGFVAVAHSRGIQIFEYLPSGGGLVEHNAPPAISSAFDLYYDEQNQELLVAVGPNPVRYLDFSDPAHTGTVFLVSGSQGTNQLAYRDGRLYCLSDGGIKEYARTRSPLDPSPHAPPFCMVSAFPNPFNAETELTIELNSDLRVPALLELSLVNVLGQTLARSEYSAPGHFVTVRLHEFVGGKNELASGVYFFVVTASGESVTRKLLLLK